jgi:uncharacterized protein (TIGR02145 family)
MKYITRFGTIMVLGLLFIYGCKKTEDVQSTQPPPGKLIDADSNIYETVTLGTQTWMAENLKTKKFRNGELIPTTTLNVTNETKPVYQWAYNDDQAIAKVYGRLYTWYAATDSRNICPTGWHVPSDTEWETLKTYLGGFTVGGQLKDRDTTYWKSPNIGGSNKTGFKGLGEGYRTADGVYVSLKVSSYFWSSTENTSVLGWGQALHYNDSLIVRGGYFKQAGVGVRCLKD